MHRRRIFIALVGLVCAAGVGKALGQAEKNAVGAAASPETFAPLPAPTLIELPAATMKLKDVAKLFAEKKCIPIADLGMAKIVNLDQMIVLGQNRKIAAWPLLDLMARQAEFRVDFLVDDSTINLVPGKPSSAPIVYNGPFRFVLDRIILQEDYQLANTVPECLVRFGVSFENQCRPLLVDIRTSDFLAKDDLGQVLTFLPPTSLSISVNKTAVSFPMALRLQSPSRQASFISQFKGRVLLTAAKQPISHQFRDLKINGMKQEVVLAGLKTQLSPLVEEDEGIWTFSVSVQGQPLGDNRGAALESFLQIGQATRVQIIDKDGKKADPNGGFSSGYDNENHQLVIECSLVDLPGKLSDYAVEVEIPSGLERYAVDFEFRNLVLP